MKVEFKKLVKEAQTPVKGTSGSAGFDLSLSDSVLLTGEDAEAEGHTGLSIAIPEGYVGIIAPRSSLHRLGLKLANTVGVIDSDYRGEIVLKLKRIAYGKILVGTDRRIAQLIIVPVPTIELVETPELTTTERGSGGFGSTGA